jgi:hypothetical protein
VKRDEEREADKEDGERDEKVRVGEDGAHFLG